jgi:hypothetical protein
MRHPAPYLRPAQRIEGKAEIWKPTQDQGVYLLAGHPAAVNADSTRDDAVRTQLRDHVPPPFACRIQIDEKHFAVRRPGPVLQPTNWGVGKGGHGFERVCLAKFRGCTPPVRGCASVSTSPQLGVRSSRSCRRLPAAPHKSAWLMLVIVGLAWAAGIQSERRVVFLQ